MIDIFLPIRSFFTSEKVYTDNNVFRMHYIVTVIMLLVFSLLVTAKQFFGDPMHCMSDGDKDIDKDAINSYCWIYGTYTLKSNLIGEVGKHVAYIGVGPAKGYNDEQISHNYYQWVCFVLLGQAVMFYIPRYIWKKWEGGRMKALVANLASPIISKEWGEFRREELVSYLHYTYHHTHSSYALKYAFCEFLNLINVFGQIYILDVFLNGAFKNYGAAVAAFTHVAKVPADMVDFSSVNPMDQYFPKLTKCWLRTYGPSGTLQLKDRLCVLPLNIVNEKIFVVLWFWLVGLALMSSLAMLFRIMVITMRPLRTLMIMGQLKYVKRSHVAKVVKRYGYGGWFVLYLLGKNINPLLFKELILELKSTMKDDKMDNI